MTGKQYLPKDRLWKTLLLSGSSFAIVASVHAALRIVSDPGQTIPNPLTSQSFGCLIKTISFAAIQVAVPIAVVAIIIAGVRYIIAAVAGKEGELAKIHKMFFWTLVGTAVVVGSFVLASAAVQLFGGPGQRQESCR